MKWKFKLGDKVTRRENVYDIKSKVLHGTVVKCYSSPKKQYNIDLILGPYPELYNVIWDDGRKCRGFLPHGLSKEEK